MLEMHKFHYYLLSISDVDECTEKSPPPCQQICENVVSSFFCKCNTGYVVSGTRCLGKIALIKQLKDL